MYCEKSDYSCLLHRVKRSVYCMSYRGGTSLELKSTLRYQSWPKEQFEVEARTSNQLVFDYS